MVQPKEKPKPADWLKKSMERINREHPIIDTRYYVVEITPAYNTGGYYDQDIPQKSVRVSDYFSSADEAGMWMSQHEPDEGKTLKIITQNKRRTVIEKWW